MIIVKYSQNWILWTETFFFGLPYDFKIYWKRLFYNKKNGLPESTPPATKIQSWDHCMIDTFAILLLWSGLGFPKIPSRGNKKYQKTDTYTENKINRKAYCYKFENEELSDV